MSVHVIESDDYRREEAVLMRDPLIIAMADEVRSDFTFNRNDLTASDFMHAAQQEYARRGGKSAHSIGGPARAIKALLEKP